MCERNPSCERSGPEEVDETEIFEGGGNRIEMQQVYTWQFQCKYDLRNYPFDTQVGSAQPKSKLFKAPFSAWIWTFPKVKGWGVKVSRWVKAKG